MRTCDICGRPLRGGTCWRCDSPEPAAAPAQVAAQPTASKAIYFLLSALLLLVALSTLRVSTLATMIAALHAWSGDRIDLITADEGIDATSTIVPIMICAVVGLRLWYTKTTAHLNLPHSRATDLLIGGQWALLFFLVRYVLHPEPQLPYPSPDAIAANLLAGKPDGVSFDADTLADHQRALLSWAWVELGLTGIVGIGAVTMLLAALVLHRRGRRATGTDLRAA